MTGAELRSWCLERAGAEETFPFSPGVSVFKVGGKIFAISSLDSDPLDVSVKCDPDFAADLRSAHESIAPGYHLNKRHWITVTVGGDAEDELIRQLIEDSYDLVKPRSRRR